MAVRRGGRREWGLDEAGSKGWFVAVGQTSLDLVWALLGRGDANRCDGVNYGGCTRGIGIGFLGGTGVCEPGEAQGSEHVLIVVQVA
jgi:hypothetical protein